MINEQINNYESEAASPVGSADDVSALRSSLWFSLSLDKSTNHHLIPQLSTWEITPPHEHSWGAMRLRQPATSSVRSRVIACWTQLDSIVCIGLQVLRQTQTHLAACENFYDVLWSCLQWAGRVQNSTVNWQKIKAVEFFTEPLTHGESSSVKGRETMWPWFIRPVPFSMCISCVSWALKLIEDT